MSDADPCALDEAVFSAAAALEQRQPQRPFALVLSMTGLGLLPGRMEGGRRLPLSLLPGTPAEWSESVLHWGTLEGLPLWLLEDDTTPRPRASAAWQRAFPVWLAAACGAATLVHCSAACSLGEVPLGAFALARDHINLSGSSPLEGLGESRLGPMFPDQTALHDAHLRGAASGVCQRLGLAGVEAVFACAPSPALETPAEQRWYRSAGADVSVQGLAGPLLAAAHAGLGTLAVGLVAAEAGRSADVARVAAAARSLAPALDDFLVELARAAELRARASLEEGSR